MKIIIDNRSVHLPKEAAVEVENTSPYFCDQGSRTTSITLPPSPQNNLFLGDPANPDTRRKLKEADCTIEAGGVCRSGRTNITSASLSAGIAVNIGFDESLTYKQIAETKLADMTNLGTVTPAGGKSVAALLDHLTAVMREQEVADYAVFPILTAYNEEKNGEVTAVYASMLNRLNETGQPPAYRLRAYSEQKITVKTDDGNAEITLPVGYGVSPFVKLHALLRWVWEYLGYELTENPFADHYQLKKLVLLNNAFDVCVTGELQLKQIMPEATINELLEVIWARFGARCFVDSNRKTVKIRLIGESLSAPAAADFTGREVGCPEITFSGQKQLKLSCKTSFEGAATDGDSFDVFHTKLNGICTTLSNAAIHTPDRPDIDKLVYVKNRLTGEYFRRDSANPQKLTRISSSYFSYDKKSPLDYEEISSPDEAIPMRYTGLSFAPLPFFDCGERHFNTSLQLSAKTDSEEGDKCPLALCFAIGASTDRLFYFGSTFGFDSDGQNQFVDNGGKTYDLDLVYQGTNGLFHRFWSGYDAFLRHANFPIEQSFLVDNHTLSDFDFSRKIFSGTQAYLAESFTQVLSDQFEYPVNFNLRSTRLRYPYNLAIDQKIPVFERQLYYWALFIDIDHVMANRITAIEKELTDYGYVQVVCSFQKYTVLTSPQLDRFTLNPPSKVDFDTDRRYSSVYQIDAEFVFSWYYSGGSQPDSYTFNEVLDYSGGFKPMAI